MRNLYRQSIKLTLAAKYRVRKLLEQWNSTWIIRYKNSKSTTKKTIANQITEPEIELFLKTLRGITPYPKIRDLNKVFKNKLSPIKVNIILRYLERSNTVEVDLDGNVIWIRENDNNEAALHERANFSSEFIEYIKTNKIDLSAED